MKTGADCNRVAQYPQMRTHCNAVMVFAEMAGISGYNLPLLPLVKETP